MKKLSKTKLLVSLMLSIFLCSCTLPVHAAELDKVTIVSSGDVSSGDTQSTHTTKTLNVDSGIMPLSTVNDILIMNAFSFAPITLNLKNWGLNTDTNKPYQPLYYGGYAPFTFNVGPQQYKDGYARGSYSIPITFSLSYIPSGVVVESTPKVVITDTSLAEGMTASIQAQSYNANSISIVLKIGFDRTYIPSAFFSCGVTFGIELSAVTNNVNMVSGTSVIGIAASVSDYSGSTVMVDQADMFPEFRYIGSLINTGNSWLNTISQGINNLRNDVHTLQSAIADHFTLLNSNLQGMYDGLTSTLERFQSSMISKLTEVTTLITSSISQAANSVISDADQNHREQLDNDNKNHDDLVHGYDGSLGDQNTEKFQGASGDLNHAEDDLTGKASYEIDYDQYNSIFQAEGTVSALAFVKTVMDAIYTALGSFAIPLTLGLLLIIITRILGYQHFSSGGG